MGLAVKGIGRGWVGDRWARVVRVRLGVLGVVVLPLFTLASVGVILAGMWYRLSSFRSYMLLTPPRTPQTCISTLHVLSTTHLLCTAHLLSTPTYSPPQPISTAHLLSTGHLLSPPRAYSQPRTYSPPRTYHPPRTFSPPRPILSIPDLLSTAHYSPPLLSTGTYSRRAPTLRHALTLRRAPTLHPAPALRLPAASTAEPRVAAGPTTRASRDPPRCRCALRELNAR